LDLPRTELKLNLRENNTIDYGTITKGRDNGIRVFEFTNTGTTPLIIYAVQSTATHCPIKTNGHFTKESSKIDEVCMAVYQKKQLLWNLMLLMI
jgi:hypothetical protein